MKLEIDDLGVHGIVVDDWDASKAFKPKTITTDYSSWITYISRRPVPPNTPITNTYYWKPITRLQRQLAFDYNKFKYAIMEEVRELNLKIDTFLQSVAGGASLEDKFGTKNYLGVTQKALTEANTKIWQKLEDITGEILQGINMIVSPDYFIGNDAFVHVTANTVNTNGIFEKIQFFANGTLVKEYENVEQIEFDIQIEESTVIMCKAQILGIEYTRQKIVTKYNSFFIGAGTSYEDIMNVEHVQAITRSIRGQYEITAESDDNIIIVLGDSLRQAFMRADISFTEIEFTEQEVTVDDKTYAVLTSVNTYDAGTYKVFING